MRRCDIHLINLDPVVGNEAANTRPGVIVSNDGANVTAERLGRGVVTVVPVTSNVSQIYPFQVLLPCEETGLDRDSKAQAEQVRPVSIERLGVRIGSVPLNLMSDLDEALRIHLEL